MADVSDNEKIAEQIRITANQNRKLNEWFGWKSEPCKGDELSLGAFITAPSILCDRCGSRPRWIAGRHSWITETHDIPPPDLKSDEMRGRIIDALNEKNLNVSFWANGQVDISYRFGMFCAHGPTLFAAAVAAMNRAQEKS